MRNTVLPLNVRSQSAGGRIRCHVHLISRPFIILFISAGCMTGEIRLNDTGSQVQSLATVLGAGSAGRLEACIDGTWGTVCDNHFSEVDAAVTCRQLGKSTRGICTHITRVFRICAGGSFVLYTTPAI